MLCYVGANLNKKADKACLAGREDLGKGGSRLRRVGWRGKIRHLSGVPITNLLSFLIFLLQPQMRKVLAVASVGVEHRELVYKEIKKIFRRTRISLDVLLQEQVANSVSKTIENGNVFTSYPYITLTIPSYELHREYLEKAYKNNVLFEKFILIISEGHDYSELIVNRDEEILREQCRNWNASVSCSFESTPIFTDIEEQLRKVEHVLGDMDIRGKITQIEAKKKFHLIQDHRKVMPKVEPHPEREPQLPTKQALLKLFFGLEVGCGRRVGWGAANNGIANNANYHSEFMDYEEDDKMKDQDEETQDIDIQIQQQEIIPSGSSRVRRSSKSSSCKIGSHKRHAKSRFEQPLAPASLPNPYLKKSYHHEVELSQMS